jgi:hypothetical protein
MLRALRARCAGFVDKLKSGEIQPISDWLIIPLNDDVPVGGGFSTTHT